MNVRGISSCTARREVLACLTVAMVVSVVPSCGGRVRHQGDPGVAAGARAMGGRSVGGDATNGGGEAARGGDGGGSPSKGFGGEGAAESAGGAGALGSGGGAGESLTACEAAGVPRSCGDGALDDGEICDDGNRQGGDGCNGRCATEPGFTCPASGPCIPTSLCGNGTLDAGEACDDGNPLSGDGCTSSCDLETGPCPGCTLGPVCGDGRRDGPEVCDDGNVTGGDGCDPYCDVEPDYLCLIPGQRCLACPAECPPGECGDGIVQADRGEQCDDGAENGPDATCSDTCTVVPYCGDGFVQGWLGELCDDGVNTGTTYDSCTDGCVLFAFCGDGVVQAGDGEQCDAGDASGYDYGDCSPSCERSAYCGDGFIQRLYETCDDGVNDGRDGTCMPDCTVAPPCDFSE